MIYYHVSYLYIYIYIYISTVLLECVQISTLGKVDRIEFGINTWEMKYGWPIAGW